MHHCKRYRSPEPDPYLSYRWKRRRSYSREHEGRLRYPSRREPPPRRSRSRSHDRLPYQRRYRERRDSDTYRCEERSPSFGEDCYGSSRSHHRRRSREREPYRARKHAHHCHKRRTRSCSSASSVSSARVCWLGLRGLSLSSPLSGWLVWVSTASPEHMHLLCVRACVRVCLRVVWSRPRPEQKARLLFLLTHWQWQL